MLAYLFAAILAHVFAVTLTPLAMRAARRFGFMDVPNTRLKTHTLAIPYLGGVALFVAFMFATLIAKFVALPETGMAPWPYGLEKGRGIYAILLGGMIALVLGLVDDKKALSPGVKFLGQIAGACVLVAVGLRLRFVRPDWLAVPLTILWVVAITNAMNFVDIMDGLAASVSAAAALVFFAFALQGERYNDALAAAALFGACLGFLGWNWAPAKVYMGDAGSHFLGFSLAAISLNLRYSHQNELAVFSPLVILGLPIFDVLLMTVIRVRKGIAPWKGSPDHIPLRLSALGFSKPRVVVVLSGLTLGLGMVVFGASFLTLQAALLVWAMLGIVGLVAAFWLMGIAMPHDVRKGAKH